MPFYPRTASREMSYISSIYVGMRRHGCSLTMIVTTILFHPVLRVYTLRLLLVATISVVVVNGTGLYGRGITPYSYIFLGGIGICVHHILAIFKWRMRCLALLDLVVVVIEMAGCCFIAFELLPIAPLILLFLSLLFRIATVIKTKEGILTQRLAFLGCCAESKPPYTVLTILLNRSLARPLVRGESRYIIFARAFVLSAIGMGVPAFGIYATIIMPLNSAVSTRTMATDYGFETGNLPGHAVLRLDSIPYTRFVKAQVNATPLSGWNKTVDCPDSVSGGTYICPFSWSDISNISLSIVFDPGVIEINVFPTCLSDLNDFGECDWNMGLPLLPGSRLFGHLTWSMRQSVSRLGIASSFTYSPEFHALQQDPSTAATPGADTAMLTLRQPTQYPTKFLQDTADASPLSGIATFGGFWTFVNGTFALLFGANVIYFAFGRRPLSALGVVHIFQRRALIRRWHEDFPAIHTEGGPPGSQNAGIVAFIRERLVDLGEDPQASRQGGNANDSQESAAAPSPQMFLAGGHEHARHRNPEENRFDKGSLDAGEARPGYILDEMPLLDVDLGRDYVLSAKGA
ncbi:hypothetical protein DFH08DRAFT_896739 [Mycena albidolilacea]|uniref:Uncharacterized protein n=1 Tax=Mycena albidolilacea TaxID=1033008 RepID=A0AAD7EDJ7_9AGAR|nr:hypothetical protein DFH08DRAFT_896739 [Mycena albidolilacea]